MLYLKYLADGYFGVKHNEIKFVKYVMLINIRITLHMGYLERTKTRNSVQYIINQNIYFIYVITGMSLFFFQCVKSENKNFI